MTRSPENGCADCGNAIDRTIPDPIPEGYECMWSELMSGKAQYCRACYGAFPPVDEPRRERGAMSEFERHVREIAEQTPYLSVTVAIQFAEAREAGEEYPLPDPRDSMALASWAAGQPAVASLMPHKPINAIKELRALGSAHGVKIGLYEAKCAIDIIRTEETER